MAISCWADSNFDPYQRRPKQLDRLCLLPRRRIMSGSEEPPLGGIPSPMPWHIRTTETGLEMTQELRKNSPKIAMDTWWYMKIHEHPLDELFFWYPEMASSLRAESPCLTATFSRTCQNGQVANCQLDSSMTPMWCGVKIQDIKNTDFSSFFLGQPIWYVCFLGVNMSQL